MTATSEDVTLGVVGDGFGALQIYAAAIYLGFAPEQVGIFGEQTNPGHTSQQFAWNLGQTVWDASAQEHPRRTGPTPADLEPDPVPAQVLARVRRPETTPPLFSGPPVPHRRSVATHRSATFFCLAIVLADAIALGFYLKGI